MWFLIGFTLAAYLMGVIGWGCKRDVKSNETDPIMSPVVALCSFSMSIILFGAAWSTIITMSGYELNIIVNWIIRIAIMSTGLWSSRKIYITIFERKAKAT